MKKQGQGNNWPAEASWPQFSDDAPDVEGGHGPDAKSLGMEYGLYIDENGLDIHPIEGGSDIVAGSK